MSFSGTFEKWFYWLNQSMRKRDQGVSEAMLTTDEPHFKCSYCTTGQTPPTIYEIFAHGNKAAIAYLYKELRFELLNKVNPLDTTKLNAFASMSEKISREIRSRYNAINNPQASSNEGIRRNMDSDMSSEIDRQLANEISRN